jgi:importin-9
LVHAVSPDCYYKGLNALRWRSIEAALACCSCNAADILELTETKNEMGQALPFDPSTVLLDVIPSLLESSDCPLLQGRCLVFASKFANGFSPDIASRYGTLSAQVIESQRADLPLKLSAVKAIRKFVFNS